MDTNIISFNVLPSPKKVHLEYPLSEQQKNFVEKSRTTIKNIINGTDSRMLIILGPCSVHDPKAVIDYAKTIKSVMKNYPHLFIVLRTYFEKPRTTIGWTGILHQPILTEMENVNLDNVPINITEGIMISRKLLSELTDLEIPVATELVETITPQYLSDYISWAAIGARTVESPVHRHLVSGVSMPVGFKNSTSGSIQVALDAINCAKESHSFIGLSLDGKICQIVTKGNKNTHIILRGSNTGPNYTILNDPTIIEKLKDTFVMVDVSHGNSNKDYTQQSQVVTNLLNNITNNIVKGIMIESFITEGKQKNPVVYGKSITDGCIGIPETLDLLEDLDFYVKYSLLPDDLRK